MGEYRLRLVLGHFFPAGEDFPVSALLDPSFLVQPEGIPPQSPRVGGQLTYGTTESLIIPYGPHGPHKRLHFTLEQAEVWILFQLFFEVNRQFVRQAIFMELLETLEIFNVTLVAFLVSERRLTIDRGAVRHVILAKYARIGLSQVLGPFDRRVPL